MNVLIADIDTNPLIFNLSDYNCYFHPLVVSRSRETQQVGENPSFFYSNHRLSNPREPHL